MEKSSFENISNKNSDQILENCSLENSDIKKRDQILENSENSILDNISIKKGDQILENSCLENIPIKKSDETLENSENSDLGNISETDTKLSSAPINDEDYFKGDGKITQCAGVWFNPDISPSQTSISHVKAIIAKHDFRAKYFGKHSVHEF